MNYSCVLLYSQISPKTININNRLHDRYAPVDVKSYCKSWRILCVEKSGSINFLTLENAFCKWTEHNHKTIVILLNPVYYACFDSGCNYFLKRALFLLRVFNVQVPCVWHRSGSLSKSDVYKGIRLTDHSIFWIWIKGMLNLIKSATASMKSTEKNNKYVKY